MRSQADGVALRAGGLKAGVEHLLGQRMREHGLRKGRGGWQDPFRASLYFLAYPPIKGGADSHDVNYKIVLHYKRRSLRSHNAAVLPKTKETVASSGSSSLSLNLPSSSSPALPLELPM